MAALIVSELNAFGILVLPSVSLILVFVVMAVVLVLRPLRAVRAQPGCGPAPPPPTTSGPGRRSRRGSDRWLGLTRIGHRLALPFGLGDYWLTVGSEILIFALFAASLQLLDVGVAA